MPLLDKALSVIAPHNCLSCGQEGQIICSRCTVRKIPKIPSRCYRCQAATIEFAVCVRCRPSVSLDRVWVRASYQGLAESLIREFKFGRAMAANSLIASEMKAVLPIIPKEMVIIPVPTANTRRRQRGYDHAQLLAIQIAKTTSLLMIKPIIRLTSSRQVGASRQERFGQLRKAFLITKTWQIAGRNILLVDDVVTTGATIEKVSSLLIQTGAKSVNAVIFAQRL